MELTQYQVVLVSLDPTREAETKKTRPCVILSPNEMNKFLRTIVIAPLTTNLKPYPTRVTIKRNNTDGMVMIDQIRTIDRTRVVQTFEMLSPVEIKRCKEVIKEAFVD